LRDCLIQTELDNSFFFISEGSKRIITKNLTPGIRVYDEKLINIENEEYRIWNPFRSKLAALVIKGSSITIKKNDKVLYLGAANGTTPSHVSDIVTDGTVFGVEFSPLKSFYIRGGYNYQRRSEMKIESRIAMVGFSWGFGIKISKFHLSYGRASYHLAGASNHFSLSSDLSSFYKKK